jgi:CheY-like chemotaxis protein
VANDVNNMLQVISGKAETLLNGVDPADSRAMTVESILRATRCASQLIHRLEAAALVEPVGDPNRKRVLLVEDDEGVRELVDGTSWRNGFSVSAYGTAEEALAHEAPFDLLLTDLGLPGLNGSARAREVRRRVPAVPVLMMSADADRAGEAGEMACRAFLHKPFSTHDLVDQVRQLLSA